MSITKWMPVERWRLTPLTLGVYETQPCVYGKQHGWPPAWHEFYSDQQCRPQQAQLTKGQTSSIQTPIRHLWFQHIPANLSPSGCHIRASLTRPGPGPWTKNIETDAMGVLIASCHTATCSKVTDQMLPLTFSICADFSLFPGGSAQPQLS